MNHFQFVRCEGGTNIPFERIVTLSIFPANKPPSGQPFHPDGEFNLVARTDDSNYVPVVSKVSTFARAQRINDEICRLLAGGVAVAGCKKRGASTYIYCRKTSGEEATITAVSQLKDARFAPTGKGVFLETEPSAP